MAGVIQQNRDEQFAINRGWGASFCPGSVLSGLLYSSHEGSSTCCILLGMRALPEFRSWRLQAPPGSLWNEPDSIDDGIPAEVIFGCPIFAMF